MTTGTERREGAVPRTSRGTTEVGDGPDQDPAAQECHEVGREDPTGASAGTCRSLRMHVPRPHALRQHETVAREHDENRNGTVSMPEEKTESEAKAGESVRRDQQRGMVEGDIERSQAADPIQERQSSRLGVGRRRQGCIGQAAPPCARVAVPRRGPPPRFVGRQVCRASSSTARPIPNFRFHSLPIQLRRQGWLQRWTQVWPCVGWIVARVCTKE